VKRAKPRRWPGPTWVDLPIRTKGFIVIAIPVVVLLVLLSAVGWFTHDDRRAQTASSQARQVLGLVTVLRSNLDDAQAAATGYLLRADHSDLAAYQAAVSPVPIQMDDLAAAVDGRAPVTTTRAILTDAQHLLETMQVETAGGPQPDPGALAQQADSQARGLRTDIAALESQENEMLAADHAALASADRTVLVVGVVAALLGIAGALAAMRLFTGGVVARLRRLEQATSDVESGRPLGELPTGADEIGRLAERVAHAADELAAQAQVRERTRDELEEILTASPIVSLRYDASSGRFTYASPNVERLLGVGISEALDDPAGVIDRFHPRDRETLRGALSEGAVRRGDRVSLTLRFRRDPDSSSWGDADAVCTPDIASDGTIVGAVLYLVDVSERHVAQRAADERRYMLESIFHASPDTIAVRDERGRVILASTSLSEVMGNDESRGIIDGLAAHCSSESTDMGPVITSSPGPDGAVRIYETRARPVVDEHGLVTGTVTISRDVTDRIRLEDSLRDASAAAERASDAKSEFLSRMSHELRTPLNAILGFAQLMELGELPEDQATSVDQIQRAGRHLLSLINEVLDISRIEAGRLTIETVPVDVDDVLAEVGMLLTPVAEAAGAHLTVESTGLRALRVYADRQRLLQVLLNLGSNALKYGGAHGEARLRTVDCGSEGVRLEVSDTGPGIPGEKQDELWVPFARLGAERTRVEGTGVGLALSKHLVELMGGSIGVRSALGEGATFWITLRRVGTGAGALVPATEGPAPTPTRPGRARTEGPGRARTEGPGREPPAGTLLVLQIEDNPSNATLVAQVLGRRSGVELLSASTGGEGLELACDRAPDLVLLDLHLPDLPGDEVVRRLKQRAALADTKIVVVSADATPSRIRRMLDLGVDGYLTKPVGVEALLRLVDRELEGSSR
jgi:signal transduction histidine kinase/CHASE3 domain sensor protein/ActR/RegA family two-component response regulator